ncbi:MAG: MMPL family transporter [Pirellulales bacterium]|nr:MMPL family transporter [Pirellulales bacterium]
MMVSPKADERPGFFRRRGLAILAVVAFLLPLIYVGSMRALWSNQNDVKSWLPAAYEETATFNWYWKHFEGDAFIVASWEGCTLDSPDVRKLTAALQAELDEAAAENRPYFFRQVTSGQKLLDRLMRARGMSREAARARLAESVIGPDGQQTCLLLTVSSKAMETWKPEGRPGQAASRAFFHAAVNHVYDTAKQECGLTRDQLHLGGPPVDNVAIDVEGERSLMILVCSCGVLGVGLSWWSLRSWKLTVVVFSTGVFSAGASLAMVWFSGSAMNAILLTMPALVFVAAISGAIHLANYYGDATNEAGIANAADRAVAHAWLPLALATGTTGIGLASLAISELMPIKMFGIYSALGVVIAFVMLMTYMPALLELWRPQRRRALPNPDGSVGGLGGWAWMGRWIIRRNGLVTAAFFVMMGAGFVGVMQVTTSVKLMRMFSPSARIIHDYAWLEEHLGPLVPVEIVLRVDEKKCRLGLAEQLHLVDQVQQAVASMDDVGSTLAASTFAPEVPDRVSLGERAAWNSLLERNRKSLDDYWSEEGSEQLWRLSARVGALTDLDYEVFLGDVRKVVEPILKAYRDRGVDGISAEYTGIVPLVYKAQHSLMDGLKLGFAGDLVLIVVAIVLLMRNWSSGILLMLPSVFPLVVVFGAMGLAGIVVDTGTVMVPAVAMGVTVDDAIHFMLWCRRGQRQGMNRADSIMFAYGDCARAIFQSWAVIGLGLSAFSLSSFVPTQRFGILMFTMLTISSIGNLVLLPALLAGPAGRWFWRLPRGEVVQFTPAVAAPHRAQHEAARVSLSESNL